MAIMKRKMTRLDILLLNLFERFFKFAIKSNYIDSLLESISTFI